MSLRDSIRMLIVDDMSVSRGLLTQNLDAWGIKHYDWVKDGEDALAQLGRSPAHLVISDYEMPKMNGLDLLETLRKNKATERIGFILITGTANPEVVKRGQQLGMNNFLKKPFTPEQLKACVEAVVGKL